MPGRMPENVPNRVPEDMPDKMPEDMSDRMPEDLPVTKRIDVMVGITRSNVICLVIVASAPDLLWEAADSKQALGPRLRGWDSIETCGDFHFSIAMAIYGNT